MIQVTMLGVGLLLLMATWKFMLRPSMLDASRDRLFDLRESMRAHFIQSGHGLNAPAYHALRGLLNSHLRYTEEITFFGVLHQMVWLQGHQDTHRNLRADVDRQFAVSDPGLAAYIREVRAKSAVIVLDYAVKSSLAGLLLALVGFAVIYTRKALAMLRQSLNTSGRTPAAAFVQAAAWSGALLALSAQVGGVGRDVALAAMEEGALHAAAPGHT
ncbi:MAG: hypothetical protein E6Q99_07555 [Elusimicrobia bacterium]|uniref:Uncharacterized protein n=2 Tax=Thauera aminoaromatica TaxID=164330 RepID=N6YTP4_THASP|nr:hypothetical protein [Thauera aminoaromatica]ENO85548.1 hypothetical protein C665_10067 [Thauera aminoaromatica S2]TXH23790.1 MAG: hypothetical protein E6Q99_07555 [Elusimicrobiota bacterium]